MEFPWSLGFGARCFASFPVSFFRLLLLENSINGFIEDLRVFLDVETLGVGLALDGVKPACAVGVFVEQRDFLLQRRVAAGELAVGDAEQIGDRFEALDPADDLSGGNRSVRFDTEPVVHHLAQHAGSEPGQPDAPGVALLPRDPEV